jgi:hypothetical protein
MKIVQRLSDADRQALDELLAKSKPMLVEVRQWLVDRGYAISPSSVRNYVYATTPRKPKQRRFTKVEQSLSPEDRREYEALIADPRTSTLQAKGWLLSRGYRISRDTVDRHRTKYLDMLDAVNEGARFAQAAVQLVRQQGTAVVSEGMLMRLEQVLTEQMALLKKGERVESRDLLELSKSVTGAVAGRETMEAIRREHEASKRKAAEAGEAAAKKGASGKDVVLRMREILGV